MAYNPGYVDGVKVANNAAYTPGLGLWKIIDSIAGTPAIWFYVTTDSLAAVQASGYVSDATFKRLKVGDLVYVFSGTMLSETASPPVGNTLGLATFAATLGVSTQFNGTPQVQLMMCSTVTAGTTTVSGVGTLTAVDPAIQSFGNLPRNLLDCGDFTTNPWQLGTSFNGSGAATSLTADRWLANSGTSQTWTAGRTANTTVAGFSAAYVWGRSVGDTHTVGQTFGQVIETVDSIRMQGLPVALSFWCVADANFAAGASGGTYIASIMSGTGIDDTGGKMFSGAWTGQTTVATQVITPSTTVQRVGPITGTVPTGATQLGVAFSYVPTTAATSPGLTAGAHESLEFMGIQLEASSMSPFEHTEVAEVVNIATRYLQVTSEPTVGMAVGPASFSASSIAQVHIPLPSPMRKAPTLTFTPGGFAITDSALGAHLISAGGLQVGNTGAITMLVTAAATLTAGLVSFMQGRSTGLGTIILNADY
jgi:hypothetical protein